jgi:hypothetical protein
MPQNKTAGASAHMPLSSAPRGRTGRLSQATRTTGQGTSAATANKARLSGGQVKR